MARKLTHLELRALEIRRSAVHRVGLSGMDALATIVAPSPDVYEASVEQALRELESREARGKVASRNPFWAR